MIAMRRRRGPNLSNPEFGEGARLLGGLVPFCGLTPFVLGILSYFFGQRDSVPSDGERHDTSPVYFIGGSDDGLLPLC